MPKEIEPIQQLIKRREIVSRVLGQRESIRESLWEESENFASKKDSLWEERETLRALKVGGVIDKLQASEIRLTDKLSSLDQEFDADKPAKAYLGLVSKKQTQLTEFSRLVENGNLPVAVLTTFQRQFETLTSLPEKIPALKRRIERIRQEEEARTRRQSVESATSTRVKPVTAKHEPEKSKSKTYTLPNGVEIGGKPRELLGALEGSSQKNGFTRDQLIKDVYPDVKSETQARSRLHALFTITRGIISGSGLEIINLTPHSARHKGEIASYYLKKPEQQAKTFESPEFSTLSRADIAMIATTIDIHRPQLTLLLRQTDVKLIEADITHDLIALTGDKIVTEFEYMSLADKSQFINKYGIDALKRAQKIIESSNFQQVNDKINDQNIDVSCLLANLSDINKVQFKSSAGQQNGIDFLKELLSGSANLRMGVQVIKLNTGPIARAPIEAVTLFDQKATTTIIPETPAPEPKQKKYSVEKRDLEIRNTINKYLDEILEKPEFKSPVTPDALTRVYKRVKWFTVNKALTDKVVKVEDDRHGRPRFDAIAIASLLYLYDHGSNLPVKLRSQVQAIVAEEFKKRQKEE